MPVIDEHGDLFGVVNAVDALALLLVVVIAAGGVFVLTGSAPAEEDTILTQTVTIETTGNATDLSTLQAGPVASPRVGEISNLERLDRGDTETWTLDVQLAVNTTADGLTTYGGERIYIGRSLTLQLGDTTVTGVITGAREPQRVSRIPTPTPTPTVTPTPTPTVTPTVTETPTPTPTPTPTASPDPSVTRTITVETEVARSVADSLTAGTVPAPDVLGIRDKTVVAASDETATVQLRLEVAVTERDGTIYFRGVAIEPGTRLRLELGPDVVVTVTDV